MFSARCDEWLRCWGTTGEQVGAKFSNQKETAGEENAINRSRRPL